jgi:hypothetical protein
MLRFPREIGLKRARCFDEGQFRRYVNSLNGKSCIYTSLYSYGDFDDRQRTAVLDRAWWDFDMNERYSMEQVKRDTSILIQRLEGVVYLVATGRGFHVHQPLKQAVQGVHWARTLDRYQRKMAEGLESLDGVGYPLKLVRWPLSYNAKRKKWAVCLASRVWAENPITSPIPNRPDDSMRVLHPFLSPVKGDFDLGVWASENPMDIEGYRESRITEITDVDGVPMLPCLSKNIAVSNPPHNIRVALAQHLFESLRNYAPPSEVSQHQKKMMVDVAVNFMQGLGWTDWNEGVTRRHLNTLTSYAKSPSCAWFAQRGLCEGPCWRDDGTLKYVGME